MTVEEGAAGRRGSLKQAMGNPTRWGDRWAARSLWPDRMVCGPGRGGELAGLPGLAGGAVWGQQGLAGGTPGSPETPRDGGAAEQGRGQPASQAGVQSWGR